MAAPQWVDATPANVAGPNFLSTDQVDAWRTQGFCLVSGVFEAALLETLTDYAVRQNPAPDDPAAAEVTDFGSAGALNFPAQKPRLQPGHLASTPTCRSQRTARHAGAPVTPHPI